MGSPLLYTYCGYSQPVSFRSSGRYLYLHFRSDDTDTRKGFQLNWKTFLRASTTTTTTSTVKPEGSSFFFNILSQRKIDYSPAKGGHCYYCCYCVTCIHKVGEYF